MPFSVFCSSSPRGSFCSTHPKRSSTRRPKMAMSSASGSPSAGCAGSLSKTRKQHASRGCCTIFPSQVFRILSEASSNQALGASHSPYIGLMSLISLSCPGSKRKMDSGRYGFPSTEAVVMSAVHGDVPSMVQTAITMLQESLVIRVGAVVFSLPDRASGSRNRILIQPISPWHEASHHDVSSTGV